MNRQNRQNSHGPFAERALMLDALSGEFRPPSDKLKRTHSLSRLAIATVTKGVGREGTGVDIFAYRPSWAEQASSTVDINLGNDIKSLTLQDHSGDNPIKLRTFRRVPRDRFKEIAEIEIVDDAEMILEVLKLELGSEVDTNKDTIAQAAQEFFDGYGHEGVSARR